MRIGIAPGAYLPHLAALTDDTIEGVFRSLGDAGATPTNTTGYTLLYYAQAIMQHLNYIYMTRTNEDNLFATASNAALPNLSTLNCYITLSTGYTPSRVVWAVLSDAAGIVRSVHDADATTIQVDIATIVGGVAQHGEEPQVSQDTQEAYINFYNNSGGAADVDIMMRLAE